MQFVCILMLSDAKNMVGGETAFRKGDGSIALVKYPAAGYAICMQVRGPCCLHVSCSLLSCC